MSVMSFVRLGILKIDDVIYKLFYHQSNKQMNLVVHINISISHKVVPVNSCVIIPHNKHRIYWCTKKAVKTLVVSK